MILKCIDCNTTDIHTLECIERRKQMILNDDYQNACDAVVDEFKNFHKKNPEVYELFKRFAFEAINKGHVRLSSEMLINRIRWETSVVTTDKDYKINNDYKPFYSRMFMAEYPLHKNFFSLRGSHADSLDWKTYVVQTAGSTA